MKVDRRRTWIPGPKIRTWGTQLSSVQRPDSRRASGSIPPGWSAGIEIFADPARVGRRYSVERPAMYISENEVRAALTYEALIPAVREALIDYSAGKVVQPARMIMRAGIAEDHRDGWFAVMPVIHGDAMGVKTVTFYRRNAELGLHTHMAIVELLNRATGEPLAVMDGRAITEMRTAAVTAVGYAALAPLHFETPPRSLGILGSGVQAKAHIEALRVVWPEIE